MKKFFSLLCVCMILLSAHASVTTAPQAKSLPLPVLQPKAAKAQARQTKQDDQWVPMGVGVATERFIGSLFTSTPTQTYNVSVYYNEAYPGVYVLYDPYAGYSDPETLTPVNWMIHAENPEYVYFTPITTSWQVVAGDVDYGKFLIRNMGGFYVDYYAQYGYGAEDVFDALGDGIQYWGKQSKNIITFGATSLQAGLSNYNGGESWWSVTENFVLVLPDVATPVISNVEVQYAGNVSALIRVTADDDADDVDSLTFTVMNGEEAILSNAKTTNGQLTITGLTPSTAYNLTLLATDRAGHASEAYPFAFSTVTEGDAEAPVLISAQIHEVSDKWVTIQVNATDNQTDSVHMVFVLTAADQTVQELAVTADSLIIIEGLTPSTAYSFTIAAKDLAGNISNALPIQFTTLDLIPIVLNINRAEAQYYEDYHIVEGRFDYYFRFTDSENNLITFDTYTAALDSISGTYTSNDYINIADSKVRYNGIMMKGTSAALTLEFISLDYDDMMQATYNISFAMNAEDGNRYIGTAALKVTTYYKSENVVHYIAMKGEVTDNEAPVMTKAEVAEVGQTGVTLKVAATDLMTDSAQMVYIVTFADETQRELQVIRDSLIALTGLTPNTAYSITVAAKDEAGNISEALPLTFTTGGLIDVEWTITEATALYDPDYSSNDRNNFSMVFVESSGNMIRLDTYTPFTRKISGIYTTAERINKTNSTVTYSGTNLQVDSAYLSLTFVSLNEENDLATYQIVIYVKDQVGNVFRATGTVQILTLKTDPNVGYTILPMDWEIPDTEAPTILSASVTVGETHTTAQIAAIVSDDHTDVEVIHVELQDEAGQFIAAMFYQQQAFRCNLDGLKKDTLYVFYISATDERGNTTALADRLPVEVLTRDTIVPVVNTVSKKNRTVNTFELYVTATDNFSLRDNLLYSIKEGEETLLDHVTVNELIIRNLDNTTEHTIAVVAIDEAGNESEPYPFVIPALQVIDWTISSVWAEHLTDQSSENDHVFGLMIYDPTEMQYVSVNIHSPRAHSISGEYTQGTNAFSVQVRYNSMTYNFNSSVINLEFVSLDADQIGTYTISFEAMTNDGKVFHAAPQTILCHSYYTEGEDYISWTMEDELNSPTGLQITRDGNTRATKILRNGQVLILQGDKIYTIMGQEVR